MSGIAGWLARGRHAPDADAILPALEALAHRGAGDGLCVFETESGHRVVLAGELYDDNIAVALDGTIANRAELEAQLARRGYPFKSHCSAETLAHAYAHWDKDVVHHLRGAFAFAIWDARKDRLMLARDRFGEKPLYACERGDALYFGSEIRALLRMPGVPAQPDAGAAHDYLACRYVPGPRTLISGIRKLMPGTCTLWQFGKLRETRYWSAPDRNRLSATTEGDPVATFSEKLEEAVKLRLPAGVLLSGGVDSAALVALASRHQKVRTFSAGFAGDRHSELARAARVAKHFGTEHHEIVLSPRDIVARLPQAVARRDAPVSRPGDVALYFIAEEVARHGGGAVLTGDGADELLGGYRRHVAERFGWGFRSLPTALALLAPFARGRPGLLTAIESLRTPQWRERAARWVGVMTSLQARKLEATEGKSPFPENLPPFDADPNASSLRRALYFDQASWLPDNILERLDRMTMSASQAGKPFEARAPYLDHRLVEFVSTLPDDLRVRGLETKWILRQAARPLLAGLAPRKAGFRVPVGEWLRGELRDVLTDHLRGGGSLTRPYYESKALDRVLDEHLAGRRNHEELLWTLLNLEIWHRNCLRG